MNARRGFESHGRANKGNGIERQSIESIKLTTCTSMRMCEHKARNHVDFGNGADNFSTKRLFFSNGAEKFSTTAFRIGGIM
jgi:hypothetical protein